MEKHLTAFSRKYIYWLTTIERKTKPTESQNNVDGGYFGGRNLDWADGMQQRTKGAIKRLLSSSASEEDDSGGFPWTPQARTDRTWYH